MRPMLDGPDDVVAGYQALDRSEDEAAEPRWSAIRASSRRTTVC